MRPPYDKPIPYGWYAVAYSSELKASDVVPMQYFGRDLVLFRSESGVPAVLDAFCPHLGAHLGHGGIVKGESISCPFHAWQFNCHGRCTAVPYAKRTPPKVDGGAQAIGSYPVVERNQMIWAWYHPLGEQPSFEVETIDEFHSPDWTEIDCHDWTVNTIIQETGENAADIAHFVTVHGSLGMPTGEITLEGHRRCTLMDSQAHAIDEQGNVDRSGETGDPVRLESWNIGPGQTFQRFSRQFDIVMMGTITPVDDQNIHMRFTFTLPRAQTEIHNQYANGVKDEIVFQVTQDIPIWEHKIYLENPTLCDGDGPIARYRRWFQQFYAPEQTPEQTTSL